MKTCYAHRWPLMAAALALVGLAAAPGLSRADSMSFSLTAANSALSALGPGPYGTVTLDRTDSTHVTVTFQAASGWLFAGGTGTLGLNVNGTATTGSFSANLSDDGNGNEDGFGMFTNRVSYGSTSQATATGSFVLTATGGTTWSSVGAVLINNNNNNEVAAHIAIQSQTGGPGATGFAAGTVSTPEFGSASLMGLMLVGFGGIVGWRRYHAPAMA